MADDGRGSLKQSEGSRGVGGTVGEQDLLASTGPAKRESGSSSAPDPADAPSPTDQRAIEHDGRGPQPEMGRNIKLDFQSEDATQRWEKAKDIIAAAFEKPDDVAALKAEVASLRADLAEAQQELEWALPNLDRAVEARRMKSGTDTAGLAHVAAIYRLLARLRARRDTK